MARNEEKGPDSSPEAKAFREVGGDLIECVINPAILGWRLYSKHLIGKDIREQSTMPGRTREEKCIAIVDFLEKVISLNPKKFHDFLEVLENGDDTFDLYERLKKLYNEIKRKTEKAQRTNKPGMAVMESHVPGLVSALQLMKSIKPKAETGEKRIGVIEILKPFIEKSLQGGAKVEDVNSKLAELHLEDLLLTKAEYNWALSNVDELNQAKNMFEDSTTPHKKFSPHSKRQPPSADQSMFTKEAVYYASLCSLTVNSCDSSNYLSFLQTSHPYHEFDEASLSRVREGEVDRYLIVKQGTTYYVAFKGEPSLMAWKKNYRSFEEGIEKQCSKIPLRFFVQQINDGYSIVFTGFQFGGLLACNIVASLCREPYLTSEQILSNVVCITFGQPLVNISSVMETARQISVLDSVVHNVILQNDILSKVLKFLEDGFGSVENKGQHDPYSSLILQYLVEVQNASYHSAEMSTSSATLKTFEDLKELLMEVLSQAKALKNGTLQDSSLGTCLGKFYMIDISSGYHWSELSRTDSSNIANITHEQIKNIRSDIICKPSTSDYFNAITRGYLEETPVYVLPPVCSVGLNEIRLLKPTITSVSFHYHGKEVAVVIEGNNLWFCSKIHVVAIPQIKIEPETISCKSIQFNYTPRDVNDIPEGDSINVHLHSHFTNPIRKHNIPVKRKVYRFTYRQEQLAKHTPSELIELAYMSALLERHPFNDSEPLSNRFQVLRSFLENIVSVVPIESVPYTIASVDDELVGPCCDALIKSKIPLPSSACMNAGMIRAIQRVDSAEKIELKTAHLFNIENRFFIHDYESFHGEGSIRDYKLSPIVHQRSKEAIQHLDIDESSKILNKKKFESIIRKSESSSFKNSKRKNESRPPGKPSVPNHFRIPHEGLLPFHQYFTLHSVQSVYPKFILAVLNHDPEHPNHYLLSQLIQIAPPPDISLSKVICGLNIDLMYPPAGSHIIQSPLDILIFGRKLLSTLIEKLSDRQSPLLSSEVRSLSQLCNTQMLHTINSIRNHNVRLCVNLLGSFMEEQMQVPLKRTSFDTAKAIFSAVSVAAMGVWALFNLSYQDVNILLSGMPNKQLFVQVKEYIKGMFSENTMNLDREYAGKLQFMVQGLDETVSCNSHYISYSLERQLVLLCDQLLINASTDTDKIVDKWNDLFKDNALSLVAISHRPLIARWMRWALMIHNLREELAKYTAVGIVGLVNSGKSKLVNSIFGIQVAIGTTECKRTTVPFLYNLDRVVEGLDVIDFPGVDDRDETIPNLAELLLSLAQVVIFVVDYRRIHTESVKYWLEHLEKEQVQVLVCLTHADQLYVEYMNEDGTHRPADIVRRELKIQLDMIKEKLGYCPRHTVQLFSICQGKDSVLNSLEGRKILQDVGIHTPLDVGDWLVKVFKKNLDQEELSERLHQYIHKNKDDETVTATAGQ